jgi:hypothetical protein
MHLWTEKVDQYGVLSEHLNSIKRNQSGYNKGTCTPMFIAALFTIAKLCGSSQDAPLLMNELRKCSIYIQWNFIRPRE